MTTTLSKFYIYTTHPRQAFEQDVSDYIDILNTISQNSYNNIMIIIGGSYWNYSCIWPRRQFGLERSRRRSHGRLRNSSS